MLSPFVVLYRPRHVCAVPKAGSTANEGHSPQNFITGGTAQIGPLPLHFLGF